MFVKAWIGTILVTTAVVVVGCEATSSTGTGGSVGSTSSSGGGGNGGTAGAAGNGGTGGIGEASSSSSSSSASSSSSSSGMGGAGGGKPFAQCTEIAGSMKDCKNCCDCASDLSCADQKACRDTCNALGAAYFMMNPNPIPVNAPSTLGPNGDYSTCTSVATEQECKACCDCTTNYSCGDHQFCRNACTAAFGDGGAPPPPDGGMP